MTVRPIFPPLNATAKKPIVLVVPPKALPIGGLVGI